MVANTPDSTGSHGLDAAVAAAADPRRVRTVIDRIGDAGSMDPELARAVVAVAAASDSLGDLVAEDRRALAVLRDLDAPVELDGADPDALRASPRRGRLLVGARALCGREDLDGTLAALTRLAADLVAHSLALADAGGLVVVGMGKFGAGELNFVSDVDVVLVSDDEPGAARAAARRFLDVAGRIVRIDTDLRPEGRDGPVVRSLDGYCTYWERWARPWEFQALLKARSVAGPEPLRGRFDAAAADVLWSRPFGAEDLREIRRLKSRAEAEVARRGLSEREVKRAPGGLRDIEFSVQLLQLVHGGADPDLRDRATLPALDRLVGGGYVDPAEASTLGEAYRFLRTVEHRLQLVNEQQTHVVPEDRDARRRLARTLGYRGSPDAGPTEQFDRDLNAHRLAVRRVHEGWYFRPLLDAFATSTRASGADTMTATRLAAFGFRDPARTEQAVRELSRGLTRSSTLMRQLLPLVLDWLSDGPDPDLGLLGLRRLATGEQRAMRMAATFRDSAETARRLCALLATAPVATDILVANPDLVERLDDVERLQTASRDDLLASAWEAAGWRSGIDERQQALHRWFRRHLLGIVAREVAGTADRTAVGADLTSVVEAVIETAVRLLDVPGSLAVIGLGRLGGRELSFASDVDLVFVHRGGDRHEAERAVAAITRVLHGATPASRIVAVDPDLRPEGRQGPLARSLDSYEAYLERWSEVWERQALLRARPVAGDPAVGREFMAMVDRYVWDRPPGPEDQREIRRIKARVEAERIRGGIEPWRHFKLGPGGLADVEWTVQLLQWSAGIRARGTTTALDRLVEGGAIGPDDAELVGAAHLWCDRARNRTWLCLGQGELLPEATEPLRMVARSLDLTTVELVEQHRRTMRRSRRVVERVFYGVEDR